MAAGGEFSGAWEALAAARGRRRSRGWGGEFAAFSTEELIRDAGDADDATRAKIEVEITRRQSKGKRQ